MSHDGTNLLLFRNVRYGGFQATYGTKKLAANIDGYILGRSYSMVYNEKF